MANIYSIIYAGADYGEAPPLAHAHNSTPTQKDGVSVSS